MRFVMALVLLAGLSTAVMAEDALPDLKGTWTGTSKSVVFGNNAYHPGTQKPRTRRASASRPTPSRSTGQDGRVLWGRTWANANPEHFEPLALAILRRRQDRRRLRRRRQPLHHHRLAGSAGALLHPHRQRSHRLDRCELRLSRTREEIAASRGAPPRSSPARGRGRAGKAASMRAISASLSSEVAGAAFSGHAPRSTPWGSRRATGAVVRKASATCRGGGAMRGADLGEHLSAARLRARESCRVRTGCIRRRRRRAPRTTGRPHARCRARRDDRAPGCRRSRLAGDRERLVEVVRVEVADPPRENLALPPQLLEGRDRRLERMAAAPVQEIAVEPVGLQPLE